MSVITEPTTEPSAKPMTVEREQVRRGAAWLDEHYPGWDQHVRLATLNMQYCSDCVLGQTVDTVTTYWNALREHDVEHLDRELGFYAYDDMDPAAWDRLAEAWRDEIVSRR